MHKAKSKSEKWMSVYDMPLMPVHLWCFELCLVLVVILQLQKENHPRVCGVLPRALFRKFELF